MIAGKRLVSEPVNASEAAKTPLEIVVPFTGEDLTQAACRPFCRWIIRQCRPITWNRFCENCSPARRRAARFIWSATPNKAGQTASGEIPDRDCFAQAGLAHTRGTAGETFEGEWT